MLKTTQKNIGKRMAVVFVEKNKEEVINIAVIREAFSKSFQITGLNREEAQNLSILLRSGALSAPMEIVEERTVGPSLGEENILAGKNSMYFGMFCSFIYVFLLQNFWFYCEHSSFCKLNNNNCNIICVSSHAHALRNCWNSFNSWYGCRC